MEVENHLLYLVLQILLGGRLRDGLDVVAVVATAALDRHNTATGLSLCLVLQNLDVLGLKLEFLGVKHPNLDTVPLVVAPSISKEVDVLLPRRPVDDRSNPVVLADLDVGPFISLELFNRNVDSVDHRDVDDLITAYVLHHSFVEGLDEIRAAIHSHVAEEVLLLAEHSQVVVQVLLGFLRERHLDLYELLEPSEVLVLRDHDVGCLGSTSLDYLLKDFSELVLK